MKTKTILAAAMACTLAGITPLLAQETVKTDAPAAPPPYRPWSVAAGVGTDGIFGVGSSWRFSDHLGARLGVNGVAAASSHVGIAGVNYDAKLRLLSEPLTLDVYPWQKSSFHVSLGILLNQNELTGTATASGNNGALPGGVGLLRMKVEQQLVDPYLSIAGNLFYFDHAHHWAMVGEMGVAYTGDAKVTLSPSVAGNSAESRLQRYADQYKWWPVVKLGVSYSF